MVRFITSCLSYGEGACVLMLKLGLSCGEDVCALMLELGLSCG